MVVVEFPTKELVANAKQSKEKIIATLTEIGAPFVLKMEKISS